jgi:hypothetical protein
MASLQQRGFYGLAMLAVLLWPVLGAASISQSADEYEVKAAFLYNFTKFVEWQSMPSSDAFDICILGDDPFGDSLDQLVKGKMAYSRRIRVRRLRQPVEARQCQIAFVRQDEDSKLEKLVEAVRGAQVLTVSEDRSFARMGGMVFLRMKDGRIGVGINVQATESAGLKVSAKLLTIAKNVNDESEEP